MNVGRVISGVVLGGSFCVGMSSSVLAISSNTKVNFKLNINPVLAISANTNEIVVDVTPTATGATGYGSSIVIAIPAQLTTNYYWSRTPNTVQAGAFGLDFHTAGSLDPQYGDVKVFGNSVRCVASPSPSFIVHGVG